MNKKVMIPLLLLSHFLCIILGFCIASVQIHLNNVVTEPGDFTEVSQEEIVEEMEPSAEPTLETVPKETDNTYTEETEETNIPETETSETEPPVIPAPPVAETQPPVTEPPATEPPATEPPATEPPATEPPATEPPATEPPATTPPVVDPVPGGNDQLPMG